METTGKANPGDTPEKTPKKPKKPVIRFKRRGRPTMRNWRDLKRAKSLIDNNLDIHKAYQEMNPDSKPASTKTNAYRLLTENVIENVRHLLALNVSTVVSRDTLVKMLHLVIARYTEGDETGANYVQAVRLLSQLVPEFGDRIKTVDETPASLDEVDKQLKALGVDLSQVFKDRN